MASEQVHLSVGGRPKVVLPAPDPRLLARIEVARSVEELAVIVSEHPDSTEAWARMGAICEPGRFKSTRWSLWRPTRTIASATTGDWTP